MGNELLQSSSFGIILFFAGFVNYFLRHNPRGVTQVQITVMTFHELFLDKSVVSSICHVRIEGIRFHTFTSVLPFIGSMSNIDPVSYLSTLNSLLCFYVLYFCFALLCFAFLWLFALILHFCVCYFARITKLRVDHCSHHGLAQVLYTRLLARGSKQRLQKQRRLRSVSIKVLKLVSQRPTSLIVKDLKQSRSLSLLGRL